MEGRCRLRQGAGADQGRPLRRPSKAEAGRAADLSEDDADRTAPEVERAEIEVERVRRRVVRTERAHEAEIAAQADVIVEEAHYAEAQVEARVVVLHVEDVRRSFDDRPNQPNAARHVRP